MGFAGEQYNPAPPPRLARRCDDPPHTAFQPECRAFRGAWITQ